ncbi:outer membrane protein transport protein [Hymenobacter sp. BT770]|uniref:OmpP1/FadL family transporter n=1 Tax=Hymenobacter sp. BT770 TaxID=2886942 RepID=UPI001D124BF6|nr:outer membrane protein transport protein [Hymenobacter sp. BT770]MCC3152643.1 outer membrane protein transport protein [Hymenobacter sp. BT770]MDO3414716.1 outer membrane protein transport protein [Hymenobacter sp. BT770]
MTAAAGGFDTGPQGARVLGLGGASTAYINSIAGLSTNPGLLAQWGDSLTRISLGGIGQIRRSSFIGQDTYQRTDQDLAIQPGGYFYATRALSKRVSFGLALTTPYGYHTKWPNNWEGRSVIQESQLSTYFAQPTVGFKLNDNFSAGVGFVYAFGKYSQRRALGQYDDLSAQTQFSATGSGMGLNVGLYGRTGDNLAFGISYRSGVNLKMKNGTATTTGVPARDAALYPASTGFSTQFNLPSTLSVGIADRITPKLLLTFDFTLSGWSTLDSVKLNIDASGAAPARRISTARRYEDALAFRVGAEYQVCPKLTVLGGLRYDESPIRDEYVNPEFIDANRLGASAGLSYQLGSRLALEAAYAFEYGQLRTGRANQIMDQVANVSGTYRTATHTASVGVAVAF